MSPVLTLSGKDELDIFKQDLSRLGVVGYFESKSDPRTSITLLCNIYYNFRRLNTYVEEVAHLANAFCFYCRLCVLPPSSAHSNKSISIWRCY